MASGSIRSVTRASSRISTGRYYDTRDYYRYDDDLGYLYRIDRDDNFVRALIPLFGGYGIGDPWPSTYYSSYVPLGYQSCSPIRPKPYYRNDGYRIYRIDAQTQLISALMRFSPAKLRHRPDAAGQLWRL